MNNPDFVHEIMDHIDPALLQQGDASTRRPIPRIAKVAIAAACLCVALIGGAFAAETIFGIPIFTPIDTSITGDPMNGFTTIIELPEKSQQPNGTTPGINGVFKLPVAAFSQQAQDTAAGLGSHNTAQLDFISWESAEAFLGIDLMNNPVLDRAEPGLIVYSTDPNGPTNSTVCSVSVSAMDGILTAVSTEAVYFLNRVDVYDESGDTRIGSTPVRLDITVQSYTEHSAISSDEVFLGLGFPEDCTFTPETYTTPNGLVANIVGVTFFNEALGHPVTMYYAQFALNGSAVTIHSSFAKDSGHALSTLKEVLDAFR